MRVPEEGPPTDSTPPAITGLLLYENPICHLSAVVEFQTDDLSHARLEIDAQNQPTRTVDFVEPGREHRLPVLGLRAGVEYGIRVSATNQDGLTATAETLPFLTGPPAADLPPVEVTVLDPGQMAPGITMLSVFVWKGLLNNDTGLLVAVDGTGEMIWYHRDPQVIDAFRRLRNGNLLYLYGTDGATEIDVFGAQTAHFEAAQLGIDTFHHDIIELPSTNLVVISTELRVVDGYQTGMGETSYNVVGDVLVEFTRSGEVVRKWSSFDHLDPHRMGTDFHLPFWTFSYSDAKGGTKDWTHANGLVHDPADGTMLVCMRHQDWLLKLDWSTGEVLWKLGEEGDFVLEGAGEWFFHAHSPEPRGDGTILLFDNGNSRPELGEEELPFSRAVEYELDEESMTARQTWEFRDEEPFYSQFVGDADRLANGNVLICDGGRVTDPAVPLLNLSNRKWARVLELGGEQCHEVVFEIVLRGEEGDGTVGFSSYRAQRLDSLYPPGLATESTGD